MQDKPLKIFISRAIKEDSPLCLLAKEFDLLVTGSSLLEFAPLIQPLLPIADWIFFTSPQGVRFFAAQHPLQACQWAVLGSGTASVFEASFAQKPHFVGYGTPKEVAEDFSLVCFRQRVLFPRGLRSERSIQKYLAEKTDTIIQELIIYDNRPKADFPPVKADYYLFTSPMNVESYFSKYPALPEQRCIAIGETTAAALRLHGISRLRVAQASSESGLAQTLQAWMEDDALPPV